MDKKIKFLKIIQNEDSSYDSATITYEDGSEEKVIGDDKVVKVIAAFSSQEKNLNILEDETKVKFIADAKSEDLVPLEEASTDKESSVRHRRSDKYKKEEKKEEHKGKKIAVRISSLVLAGVLGVIGYEGFKGFLNMKKGTPSNSMEDSMDEAVLTSVDGVKSIIREERELKIEDNGSAYPENIKVISENDTLITQAKNYLNGNYTSYDELMSICDGISMRCLSNVTQLRDLINGGRMTGDYYELHLEPMFQEGSFDYIAVKDFCDKRNIIVNSACNKDIKDSKKRENAKQEVKEYLDSFVDFLYNGKIMYGTREFDYLDLSKLAQYDIVSLGLQMLTSYDDYSKNIRGTIYSSQEIQRKIYNDYYGYLMEDLEQSLGRSY